MWHSGQTKLLSSETPPKKTPMKTLTYIRHAESVANVGGITMPHDAIPLSVLGRRQAAALAATIPVEPSTIFVSGFIRTHETAMPFCQRHAMATQVLPSLDEFSVIDPALIEGLNGAQRKPFVKEYWANPDPLRRLGENADTFAEFEARVQTFIDTMDGLPDAAVIFGHGIWFGMLHWLLLGYRVRDAAEMCAFRRFQQALPMPNCAVFTLMQSKERNWSIRANTEVMRHIASVQVDV